VSTTTIFLDTQQWNYLLAKPGHSDDELTVARGQLINQVTCGALIVVGSLPLLQELMGVAVKDQGKYEQLRQLVFAVVGNRWLLPLNERYVGEIVRGGLLPESGRYIRRPTRRKIEQLSRKPSQVVNIADATHGEVSTFKGEQDVIRREIYGKLGAVDGRLSKDIHTGIKQWWDRRDLGDWVSGIVDASIERGHIPSGTHCVVSVDTMPSVWHFTDFKHGRIKLNLGEQRSIKPSDYVDADIYGLTPYIDTLVTDDRAFRETCQLLDDGSFTLSNFEGLLEMLQS
jgi:hypothetical protein